ncbi:thiamine biosynthesis protein ThiF [Nocardia sp. SYP-A9097]|uniref:ThiF family adenylyltransferase n=1 Tax=Nocardia sp. SYP-A9097 TaxID=2663237 RepID=UPI001324BE1F|nr:ThiF family adenylyltransferase [Nocardia sp. SYP-A9097]MRH91685.1 thiamine biosynthesis protein ThiF [Nocardia sp. SYP-A9097]
MMRILDPQLDRHQIDALLAAGYRLVDAWSTAANELRELDPESDPPGVRYAVYDWRHTLVELPDPESFWRLRTARNRYLIDEPEQRAWARALIGIAGLSVGSSALTVCALTGAQRFHLADPDRLGVTNLNRLPASVCDIGTRKTTLARRRVLELDPYASLRMFSDGVTPASADHFLGTAPGGERLTVLVEEMDDLTAKVDIRRRARRAGIPVVMATDNGDNAIVDIERFDLDPDYPLFHGRAGDLTALSGTALADPRERARIAQHIVGPEITPRTRYSLTEVGRSLQSWPQLGTAATLAGATAAYAARLIACGHALPSGRYRLDLDRALLGDAADTAQRWNELSEADFRTAMASDPTRE